MKITYRDIEMKLESAVEHAAYPDAYSYESEFEKLQAQNKMLSELVARLIEITFGESSYKLKNTEKVAYILGYGYEVEE